jgi:hypothetical protein
MSPNKVAICVPHMESVSARFWLAMQNLSAEDAEVFLLPWCCSYVTSARNTLAINALNAKATHVMFVDSDMTFPANVIDRLLSWGKEIVGATYVKRSPDHEVVCRNSFLVAGDLQSGKELVEMLAMPTGMLLIEAGVFSKLKKPWFRMDYVEECEQHPDGLEIGEDVYFCREARKVGVRAWCDVPLSKVVGHLGIEEHKVPASFFEAGKRNNGVCPTVGGNGSGGGQPLERRRAFDPSIAGVP